MQRRGLTAKSANPVSGHVQIGLFWFRYWISLHLRIPSPCLCFISKRLSKLCVVHIPIIYWGPGNVGVSVVTWLWPGTPRLPVSAPCKLLYVTLHISYTFPCRHNTCAMVIAHPFIHKCPSKYINYRALYFTWSTEQMKFHSFFYLTAYKFFIVNFKFPNSSK